MSLYKRIFLAFLALGLFLTIPTQFLLANPRNIAEESLNITAEPTEVILHQEPYRVIGGLLNIVLSVVGIVLVIYIVYAGFKYFTAGGRDEVTVEAKKIIRNAIIGIILVILAFAISNFVINMIGNAIGEQTQTQATPQ